MKFIDIGVEKQYSSTTVAQADFHFNRSCTLCVLHGLNLSCKQCHIDGAHDTVVKMLEERRMA